MTRLLLIVLSVALPLLGQAQTPRAGAPTANQQALLQMQQLASERTTLQAENSRLKADLEKLRKERDSLKAAQENIAQRGRGAEAELAKVNIERARLEGEVAQSKERLQELLSRFRETAGSLREVETGSEGLQREKTSLVQQVQACVKRNVELVALNGEVLDTLERQGMWSALARKEPFTQIERVRLENLAEGYRDRASDLQMPATPAATP